MESRKRPNEDDASGPTMATTSTEPQTAPITATTQPPPEHSTLQSAGEQNEDTKMDVDASSSGDAVSSPTVAAAATLAAKDFSNKRVKLTKEAEKTGSDYSPSSDIPDPATQSTESKGVQEWMNKLDGDNKDAPAEGIAEGMKDSSVASSTEKTLDSSDKDKVNKEQNDGSEDKQSDTAPSQTVGQLKVNPELLALLAPTDASSPTTAAESTPASTSSAADASNSKGTNELSNSILAVASLSEPMVEAATALENNKADDGESASTDQPNDSTSKDLIQLLTNPSGTDVNATTSSSSEETATKQSSAVDTESKEANQHLPSVDHSASVVAAAKGDEHGKDQKEEAMQLDPVTASEPTPQDAKPSTEPSTATDNAAVKSPVTRYEGDDVIMTIATGPSAASQEPAPAETSGAAEQHASGTAEAKPEDIKDRQPRETQSNDRTAAEPEQRPASPLPPIAHGHSLSHSGPRMSTSDPSLHERKMSLTESLPPISSLSGAQSLPSLHQPPRSSMSLSAMLINNDDDDRAQEPPQPPRMPRNIFDQPPSSSRGASPPNPPPSSTTATQKPGPFQSEVVPKTEPTHRALPRYSPTSGETTPQQPVDEPRTGPGGIGGKDYAADETMESGGGSGYAGHRHRHESASEGRPSPAPVGGPMDKLPGLATISQSHSAPSLHTPPGGPPPPPGRYMPGYPSSHQPPPPQPHSSAPLPAPQQHAGHPPPPSHHGHAPPHHHHHHHPHGAPPPPSQQQQQQQQHGPHHPHHHTANGHSHYPGPPPSMMPLSSSHGSQYHAPPAQQGATAPAPAQRPRLIVKNNENLQMPDRPEHFLGYYRYEPGVLLPPMEGKENSLFEVRIASSYLTYDNPKVRKRYLWGTDIYTDDSDIVAMIIHMGLFIPPLSSQSTEQEQFMPQTQQHNFVEYQAVPRHLCPAFDLAVTLRVQPRLVKYQGSIRQRIRSRSWRTQHDGVSLKVESIRQMPLGHALNRGRSQSKLRMRETNAERLRVLSDRYDDDTTESLQNEKALRAATFEFTQQGDPCFKYTPELVMDRHDGLSRKWTSWRLKNEVLILENDEERYEISLQHQAGTDSRRFDRYRVAVISPRTSLSLSQSSRNPTTYPLDPNSHQLVEILYEDLDWQDFEWVERGVVIQPDRYGTSAAAALIPQRNGGSGGQVMEESAAMEGIEMAASSAMNGRSAAVGGLHHKESAKITSEHPREEGVFCLVSRLYWRPMSEKRPEATTATAAQPAAVSSSSSSSQAPQKEAGKTDIKEHPPSVPAASDKADVAPVPSSSTLTSQTSVSSAPALQPESAEKGSANAGTVEATAAVTAPTSSSMETEKEEGELEEGEVAE
ncbi:hypothetical protein BGZ73_003921 [Actinomortierella ambigua]|nr:hypothetical protein BGZ73_003921 [Actinomortierella ambigua]